MLKSAQRKRIRCLMFLLGVFAAANAFASGEELFRTECAQCHAVTAGAESAVGPSLTGVVDQPAARLSDYAYSDALRKQAKHGLVWDAATLDRFLLSPAGTVPGLNMGYTGMASASERQALIEWLRDAVAVSAASAAVSNNADPDVQRILSIAADPDYGEYLAAECLTCHSGDGAAGGVPPINGLPKHYTVRALLDYKIGARENPVMNMMAGALGDDELAALAAFFANNKP